MEIVLYKSITTALAISVVFTPVLVKISRRKGYVASVNHRSSHALSVPNTGGIILCFAVLTPLILFSDYPQQADFSVLITAFAVLLITGIIDDFNPIPVTFKFLGQFIPAIVIVTSIDQQELVIPFIKELVELPFIFNYLFWIVFVVMSINAFNLIDGIDGLALGLGMVSGMFYSIYFFIIAEYNLLIFSISLVFGLLGLFFYNITDKFKIFIGDTGSLLIGGLLVFFALKYIDFSGADTKNQSFFMVLASIFIPLADMLRIALVRIAHGQSPFKADRQHIHHIMLDLLGKKHLAATSVLLLVQIMVLYLFHQISLLDRPPYFYIIITSFLVYFMAVHVLKYYRDKQLSKDKCQSNRYANF
ncbi:MAG: undecaprenyl/decaprenyl-phosphate alpha-N-acetylglucosaminyl 1-phosphate transferase [Cyclobacteriaceae bacterium]|nr:undecaprenyl/decaprenyl-phosphate alpha-N-acetylglucosaminyl 1-phosphate transferase [Cyclobacteriaceae bacterium]